VKRHLAVYDDAALLVQLRKGTAPPLTRAECATWVGCRLTACKFHLDNPADAGAKPRGGNHVCALNVADQGEWTLAEIAQITGFVRQGVHDLERRAIAEIRRCPQKHALPSSVEFPEGLSHFSDDRTENETRQRAREHNRRQLVKKREWAQKRRAAMRGSVRQRDGLAAE
jgi:hypothetical protein